MHLLHSMAEASNQESLVEALFTRSLKISYAERFLVSMMHAENFWRSKCCLNKQNMLGVRNFYATCKQSLKTQRLVIELSALCLSLICRSSGKSLLFVCRSSEKSSEWNEIVPGRFSDVHRQKIFDWTRERPIKTELRCKVILKLLTNFLSTK